MTTATYRVPVRSEGATLTCFHCGESVPAGAEHRVTLGGIERAMCCAGCAAVAQVISGAGLEAYYASRDAMPQSRAADAARSEAELACYDDPAMQTAFVHRTGDGRSEASLMIEGLRCAACAWLNEQHLARLPGVESAQINYATQRARVVWDPARVPLSGILRAVRSIGYDAVPYDAGRQEQAIQRERLVALRRLVVAGVGMMQVMMYAFPVYMAGDGTMTWDIEQLMRWASFILTVPVVLYSAAPFFRGAWSDLRRWRVGMDLPVALGVGSAFAASTWATVRGSGEVYYDSITMFVFLLLCGRFLELLARRRAFAAVERLARAQPAFTTRIAAQDGPGERVPVAALRAGDLIRVAPGETIPADGVIVAGACELDESLLTGESMPVSRRTGDAVTGGAINRASPIEVRVARVGQDTVLAAIVRLTDRALTGRAAIALLADRVAGWFVLALLFLTAGASFWWLHQDPSRAFWVAVSMLVVSCPCALSLATPAALAAATGRLTRRGVLVTRSHALETLDRATHFVFDKTGTLTRGELELLRATPLGGHDRQKCLAVAAALERGAEHPIGRALRAAWQDDQLPVTGLRNTPGGGLEGVVLGRRYRLGSAAFVGGLHGEPAPSGEAAGSAIRVMLADEGGWLAEFVLGDRVRLEVPDLLTALRQSGRCIVLLSGDEQRTVDALASSLGIEDARGSLSPQQKLSAVQALQRDGAIVAMVGDGINDAPVLAAAQVSVALGSGTELAQQNADVVLLSGGLTGLMPAWDTARATLRVVRQNLVWAFAYNVLAIPLAALGHVTPWMAGVGMSASSLLVVLNALRLARGGRTDPPTPVREVAHLRPSAR